MFGIKKKEKATVKVNVGKAVALVATDDQDFKTRKITRVGYTQHGQYVVTGESLIQSYLSEHQTLLRDDNDQWFPVSRIRNIVISNEDFFVEEDS